MSDISIADNNGLALFKGNRRVFGSAASVAEGCVGCDCIPCKTCTDPYPGNCLKIQYTFPAGSGTLAQAPGTPGPLQVTWQQQTFSIVGATSDEMGYRDDLFAGECLTSFFYGIGSFSGHYCFDYTIIGYILATFTGLNFDGQIATYSAPLLFATHAYIPPNGNDSYTIAGTYTCVAYANGGSNLVPPLVVPGLTVVITRPYSCDTLFSQTTCVTGSGSGGSGSSSGSGAACPPCVPACYQFGSSGTWTAPADGELTLIFNDTHGFFYDNSGSWTGFFGTENGLITVLANNSNGITIPVTCGTKYIYRFSGTASNGAGVNCGPDGVFGYTNYQPFFICPNCRYCSLVGLFTCPGSGSGSSGTNCNGSGISCSTNDMTTAYSLNGLTLTEYVYNSSTGGIDTFPITILSSFPMTLTNDGDNIWSTNDSPYLVYNFSAGSPNAASNPVSCAINVNLTNSPLDSGLCGWMMNIVQGPIGSVTSTWNFCGLTMAESNFQWPSPTGSGISKINVSGGAMVCTLFNGGSTTDFIAVQNPSIS